MPITFQNTHTAIKECSLQISYSFPSNPDITSIIADIQNAIEEREAFHHDLEKFAEEARIHQRRGELFQEKKFYQKALNEYSKVLYCKLLNICSVLSLNCF